jgi:hypothetical protein
VYVHLDETMIPPRRSALIAALLGKSVHSYKPAGALVVQP